MLNNLSASIKNLSPNLRKVLKNIGWLLAERVLRMVVGFFILAWIARYLGADNFGLLNYAIAFFSMFSVIAQLGLNQIVVRDLVSKPSHKDEILGTTFFLKLVSGIAAFLLATITIFLLRPDDPTSRILVIITAASSIIGGFYVPEFWFQAQVQSKYTVWARNIAFILMTLVKIVLIQTQAAVVAFAWVNFAEATLTAIGLMIAYQKSGQKIQAWCGSWRRAKSLMKVSWPLIFSNVAIIIYLYVDQVMLGQLTDNKAVGIYAVAVRLSEVWPFAATAIVSSVAPSLIEAKKISEKIYYEKIQKLCNLLGLIVYAIAIPMTFFSTPLVVLIFGQEYAPAGLVLSIHIWSSLFVFMGYVKEIWIATEELTGYALAASFFGAFINILLNLWLIPIYREVGAAIATVISYGLADYGMCFIYPPARKFGWVMTKAIGLGGISQIRGKV
jgi:PST family polysaccharide transporter